MASFTHIVILSVVLGAVWCKTGKYTQDVNRADVRDSEKAKFRQKQVNQVWEKALRKNLHENKLEDLRRQLKKIDEKFLTLKKDKNNINLSPEQYIEQENIISRQLEEAMVRFDIIPAKDPNEGGVNFRDKRIHQLWSSALKNEEFSKEELDILRKDLLEHQRKVEEFQSSMKNLHKPVPSENEVTGDEKKRDPVEKRQADIEMKLKHHEINQDFQRLSVQVIPEEERAGFTDHKVIQLWQEAQISNFSPEELQVIQEELKAFEKEIQLSDNLHKQVLHAEKDHYRGKNNKHEKDHADLKEKRSILNSAREELQVVSRKVTDFMRGFKERLGKVGKKQEL